MITTVHVQPPYTASALAVPGLGAVIDLTGGGGAVRIITKTPADCDEIIRAAAAAKDLHTQQPGTEGS